MIEKYWFLRELPNKFEQTKYGLEQVYSSSEVNYKIVTFAPLTSGVAENVLISEGNSGIGTPIPLSNDEMFKILENNEFERNSYFVWEFLVNGERLRVVPNDNCQTIFVASICFNTEIQAQQFDDSALQEYMV